ncbi:MAG: sulfurtransferase TusA family protein [Nitrospira sp.]|nr:sulfurtransferase TusA family protein [Nitrospira sp.]
MGELSNMTPTDTLDVLGKVCPYPLVMTKKALEKLPSGAILKVLTDSPPSAEDSLPRLCEKLGYKFESLKNEEKGFWEIYIQKSLR